MSEEIELKYRVGDLAAAERVLAADRLGPFTGGAGGARATQMEDRYVDTADGALARAGFAVRLRQKGGETIVSVKSLAHADARQGREQEVVVLFADLRGFTRLAEQKLPYDVVFFLNRYFEVVGAAIERAGGIANQFTGDGVMALFGVGLVGGAQVGYASLVDLRTGQVLWFNRLARLSGDLREPEKATETLEALLENFPAAK